MRLGFLAASPEDLAHTYKQQYGNELSTDVPVDEFFVRCYPELCRIIDRLRDGVPTLQSGSHERTLPAPTRRWASREGTSTVEEVGLTP